jgi:SAM-dependent methyltransferase
MISRQVGYDGEVPAMRVVNPSEVANVAWPENFSAWIDFLGEERTWAAVNEFGKNYPHASMDALIGLLNIKPDERVLDVGGGDNPFKRADVIVEPLLDTSPHRANLGPVPLGGRQYIRAVAECLPFADKSFDLVFSRCVLEHVRDPAAACAEMIRVGRRGFIEVPSLMNELLMGHPTHRWLVSMDGEDKSTLVFQRRKYVEHPFAGALGALWRHSLEFRFRWEVAYRNLAMIQFYWEGEFSYKVHDDPTGFDYSDPMQALLSTASFFLNPDIADT